MLQPNQPSQLQLTVEPGNEGPTVLDSTREDVDSLKRFTVLAKLMTFFAVVTCI